MNDSSTFLSDYKQRLFFIAVLVVVAGILIRITIAVRLPFYGDECGTMKWICESHIFILTNFKRWLTMNVFISLEKAIASVFGEHPFVMRLLPVTAGAAAIIAIMSAGKALFSNNRIALLSAFLLAFNPYFIRYSVFARSYSLLVFFSVLLLLAFLRWRTAADRRNCLFLSITCMLTVLLHLNGFFVVAWLASALLLEFLYRAAHKKQIKVACRDFFRLFSYLLPLMTCTGLYYLQFWNNITSHNVRYSTRPPYEGGVLSFIYETLHYYFGYGSEAALWCFVLCMIAGAYHIIRVSACNFILICLWLIVPAGCIIALEYHHISPWHTTRYFIFMLPVLILFAAAGIDSMSRILPGKKYIAPLLLILLLLSSAWIPDIVQQYTKKERLPFDAAAEYILKNKTPRDRIVGLGIFTLLQLSPYMECEQRLSLDELTHPGLTIQRLVENARQTPVIFVTERRGMPAFSKTFSRFGYITVSEIPPESPEQRYRRLRDGFEQAAEQYRKSGEKPLYEYVAHILSFMDTMTP